MATQEQSIKTFVRDAMKSVGLQTRVAEYGALMGIKPRTDGASGPNTAVSFGSRYWSNKSYDLGVSIGMVALPVERRLGKFWEWSIRRSAEQLGRLDRLARIRKRPPARLSLTVVQGGKSIAENAVDDDLLRESLKRFLTQLTDQLPSCEMTDLERAVRRILSQPWPTSGWPRDWERMGLCMRAIVLRDSYNLDLPEDAHLLRRLDEKPEPGVTLAEFIEWWSAEGKDPARESSTGVVD